MFDLTRERIRQIEKRALEKLCLADEGEILRSFLS
jgi:DNA-directed RNA polymerase sigma subunit (sigma70/sigma32)